jgi:hypothetical protein
MGAGASTWSYGAGPPSGADNAVGRNHLATTSLLNRLCLWHKKWPLDSKSWEAGRWQRIRFSTYVTS